MKPNRSLRRSAMSALALSALSIVLTGVAPVANQTVNVWPGRPPGTETWTQKERVIKHTPVGTVILNVVTPTLTAYLPERAKATGTGIIVAPGGYCVALAMDRGGNDVAQWLQKRGIAAFVLTYRIAEKEQEGVPNVDEDVACKFGIADGIRAIALVRERAAAWNVRPNRVGFIGFSAGGMIASGAVLQPDATARPDFAAFIYGAPFGVMPPVPSNLPPIFMAWAQDDPIALVPVTKFYDALRAAGNKPEAHIFSAGGHGFGIAPQRKSSDHWMDEFYYWLQSQGLTAR